MRVVEQVGGDFVVLSSPIQTQNGRMKSFPAKFRQQFLKLDALHEAQAAISTN